MDPYLAMMGEEVDPKKRRMLSKALQAQAAAGGALSTSSIGDVANQGSLMQRTAQDTAQNIGLQKAKQDQLAYQEKQANIKNAIDLMDATESSRGDWAAKASNSALEKFESAASDAQKLLGITKSYKEEYQSTLPFRTPANIENAIAQNLGIGNKDQAQWWAALKQTWELPERNSMFGSALTTSELAEWNRAAPSPGETADSTKAKLAILEEITNKALARMRKAAERKGWDREYVDSMLDSEYNFADIIEGSAGPPKKPSDFTDEELMEALRSR